MKFLYYSYRSDQRDRRVASYQSDGSEVHYVVHHWIPKLMELTPPATPLVPFGVWWLFHRLQIFANQDYSILAIYDGDSLVHRSCVFPRYFRFPFMAQNDLQIGDTWTHPDHRGKGLATFAIHKIVETLQRPDRTFWYVVEQNNHASIRVIEKAGFVKVGEGVRTKRLGLRALGAYVILQPTATHR